MTKRRKRNPKIEDYNFEFENFFTLKKKFQPFSPDGTYDSERVVRVRRESSKLK